MGNEMITLLLFANDATQPWGNTLICILSLMNVQLNNASIVVYNNFIRYSSLPVRGIVVEVENLILDRNSLLVWTYNMYQPPKQYCVTF